MKIVDCFNSSERKGLRFSVIGNGGGSSTRHLRGESPAKFGAPLSARQQQIVDLICEGYSHREIAERIGLKLGTVKVYLTTQITPKLGCKTSLQIATKVLNERIRVLTEALPASEGAD